MHISVVISVLLLQEKIVGDLTMWKPFYDVSCPPDVSEKQCPNYMDWKVIKRRSMKKSEIAKTKVEKADPSGSTRIHEDPSGSIRIQGSRIRFFPLGENMGVNGF
jgi:hypothetical protein